MNKSDLLTWLHDFNDRWEALLAFDHFHDDHEADVRAWLNRQ